MKALLVTLIAIASVTVNAQVNYSNQVVLSSSAYNIKLADAEYALIPTRTEERPVPGCNPYGEASNDCTETIVLESEEVIRANIKFSDSAFSDDGFAGQWTSVLLRTSDFSADEVASLKAVYPSWKHPFTKVPVKFAKEKLSLTVQKVKQAIQVVDMKRSKLCRVNDETGEKVDRNCQDQIVYKDSWTMVHIATVTRK